MKKYLKYLLAFTLLSGCSAAQPEPVEETIDKTLEEEMSDLIAMTNGDWIEQYRTVYPKDSEQQIIKDNIQNQAFGRNEICAQRLVFQGFDNQELTQLNETLQQAYEDAIDSVEYNEQNPNLIQKCQTLTYEVNKNEDVISVIQIVRTIEDGESVSDIEYTVWNLENGTGNFLSNEQLVSDYGAMSEAIGQSMEEMGVESSEEVAFTDESYLFKRDGQWMVKVNTTAAQQAMDIPVNIE